jgi:competence CoiA-like predicted nuclease
LKKRTKKQDIAKIKKQRVNKFQISFLNKKNNDLVFVEDEEVNLFRQKLLKRAFDEFKRRQTKFYNEVNDLIDFEMDTENIKLMMTEFVYHYCQARRSLHGDLMFSGITVGRDQIMAQGDNSNNLFNDARSQ